jgi:hypothetical protein
MNIQEELKSLYKQKDKGLFSSETDGYWSNLSKEENTKLLSAVDVLSTREALIKYQPKLEDVIYSPKRAAGLELLGLTGDEFCIDYGCMWGALTIPLAKRVAHVLGVDQTEDSLKFLQARAREEGLQNIDLLRADLRKLPLLEAKADVGIINGVLEWIPENGQIALKDYYGKHSSKTYSGNPQEKQQSFLKRAFDNLKQNGRLFVAIENRYDFKMFMGVKDPHANLMFTSFLPRALANVISKVKLGRPYVNWIYSFSGLKELLLNSGASSVELYMCFPNYQFPDQIIPLEKGLSQFRPTITVGDTVGARKLKRYFGRAVEKTLFKSLQCKQLSPSIIAIAYK